VSLRHATALALLGWYLLLLPPNTGKPLPDTSLPLTRWEQHGEALESLPACEAAKKAAIAQFEGKAAEYAKIPGNPRGGWIRFHHDQVYRALCVADDDSALKVIPPK
jgi:hypothetical protein